MGFTVLIVDDDPDILADLEVCLSHDAYKVISATSGEKALELMATTGVDVVITDIFMPGMSGLDLLKLLRKKYPAVEVLVMTTHASIESAVEAMKNGAVDYLPKPVLHEELLLKISRLKQVKKQEQENFLLRGQLHANFRFGNIIGKSQAMRDVFDRIQMVADSDSTVIIRGPSGTGKELVAGALHYNSSRKNGPFVKVGCGIFNPEILESELFGHEKGAFTGALRHKPGRFEMADGGTIFLDDVDDISMVTQLKLLRVLQEREFEKVGGERTIKVDVRVIAATKVDLKELVEQKKFREDLYFRLNVIPITLPPLRERKEDIRLLMRHFVEKYDKAGRIDFDKTPVEVLRFMENYHWAGNVRELENAVEHAVAFCRSEKLELKHFPEDIIHSQIEQPPLALRTQHNSNSNRETVDLRKAVKDFERQLLQWAWNRENGHQGKMAKLLKIPRTTLRDKLLIHELISKSK